METVILGIKVLAIWIGAGILIGIVLKMIINKFNL